MATEKQLSGEQPVPVPGQPVVRQSKFSQRLEGETPADQRSGLTSGDPNDPANQPADFGRNADIGSQKVDTDSKEARKAARAQRKESIEALINDNTLEALQEQARNAELPVSGTKAELAERIVDAQKGGE